MPLKEMLADYVSYLTMSKPRVRNINDMVRSTDQQDTSIVMFLVHGFSLFSVTLIPIQDLSVHISSTLD